MKKQRPVFTDAVGKSIGGSGSGSGGGVGDFTIIGGGITPEDLPLAVNTALTAPSLILSDNFTRADTTGPLGVAPTGQTWTSQVGTWGIQTNRAYCSSPSGDSVNTFDAGWCDGTYSVDFTINPHVSSTNTRAVFRLTSSSNYLWVQSSDTSYQLYKRVSSSNTLLASSTGITPADGDNVTIILNSFSIQVKINNVLAISFQESFNSGATRHGIGISGASAASARFDNATFTV